MLTFWAHFARILAIFTCAYAFWRGGPYEKRGAAILAIGWIATFATQIGIAKGINYGIFVIDIAAFIAFLWLSLVSRQFWALLTAAFQLDVVACEIIHYIIPMYGNNTYITAVGFWGGYGLTFALLGGLIWKDIDLLTNGRKTQQSLIS